MTKEMKDAKNEVLKRIKNSVSDLFEESRKAEDITYASDGISDYEKPGTYNTHLTQLMVRDIRQLWLFSMSADPVFADAVKNWADLLENKDLQIRRMFDDRKDRRRLSEFPFDDSASVIREMESMSKEERFACNVMTKAYEEKAKKWAARLVRLDMLAYYLQTHDALDRIIRDADMRGYDEDGNLVFGIPEKDGECVHVMAAMVQILLKAFIRIPAGSKEIKQTMARIESMLVLMEAVAKGDGKTLDYLAKCAEAAEDFGEED